MAEWSGFTDEDLQKVKQQTSRKSGKLTFFNLKLYSSIIAHNSTLCRPIGSNLGH